MRVSRFIGTKMSIYRQMKYLLYIAILISLLIGCSGTKEVNEATTNKQIEEVDNPKEKAMEHFLNGSIAEQEGDYQNAILEYQNALKYDTSSGIYYALAKSYLANNKLSNALQSIRLAVENDPEETEYYNLMADIFIIARENDSAAVVLEKLIELDSTDVNTYYKLARVY